MTSESLKLGPPSESWGTIFLRSQYVKPVLPSRDECVAGQTVILTGGNQGLGFTCAEWLLELHVGRLILAVRTQSKGEAAAAELRKKFPKRTIDVWQIDMLSYNSIQAFVERCKTLDRLDIAILNAGLIAAKFELSPEGHEKTFQVNYLSTTLLATLLLPILKAKSPPGKPGRLTIVSSGTAHASSLAHRHKKPFIPNFDDPKLFDSGERYWESKAVGHFWIRKLVEKVKREDVIVNLVDPGLTKSTSLNQEQKGLMLLVMLAMKSLLGRSIRDGASTYVDAAVVKSEESHGSFVMDWRIFPFAAMVYGDDGKAVADQLWEETMDELAFANLREILDSL